MSRLGQKSEWVGQVEGELLSQLEPTPPLGLGRFGTNGTSGTRFFERPANSAEGCFPSAGIFGRDEELLSHLSHPLRINSRAALGGTSELSQTCPRLVPPLLGALEYRNLAAQGLRPDRPSHGVRRRKPVSMRFQGRSGVRWTRTNRDPRFRNPPIYGAILHGWPGSVGDGCCRYAQPVAYRSGPPMLTPRLEAL
jgi:hypothetical protein